MSVLFPQRIVFVKNRQELGKSNITSSRIKPLNYCLQYVACRETTKIENCITGTPISSKDRSTREVFGDYIDIYDMTQAVEDGATRPVYYESRVIKLNLDEATLKLIDAEYDIMAANAHVR